MTADTPDYEHVWPPYNQPLPPAHAGQAPEPLRKFDVRTSEERLVMWCASLERRLEDQAQRLTALEIAMHRQGNVAPEMQLSLLPDDVRAHRLLNPDEEAQENPDPDP